MSIPTGGHTPVPHTVRTKKLTISNQSKFLKATWPLSLRHPTPDGSGLLAVCKILSNFAVRIMIDRAKATSNYSKIQR